MPREFVFRIKNAPERRVVVKIDGHKKTTLNIDGDDVEIVNESTYRDGGTTYLYTRDRGVIRIAQRTFEKREQDVDMWTVDNGSVTVVHTLVEEPRTQD